MFLFDKDMLMRVPEGSLLKPLLLVLYVDAGKKWIEAQKILKCYLRISPKWLARNKLYMNIDKTVYVTFGNYCDSLPDI